MPSEGFCALETCLSAVWPVLWIVIIFTRGSHNDFAYDPLNPPCQGQHGWGWEALGKGCTRVGYVAGGPVEKSPDFPLPCPLTCSNRVWLPALGILLCRKF